jgi:hypothetical protein
MNKLEMLKKEEDQKNLGEKIDKLEKSDIAGDLKELMSGLIEKNLESKDLETYASRVKEKGGSVKIGELLDGMADIYLGQHPDLAKKFHNGEVSPGQMAEGIFDLTFQNALDANKGPDRVEQRKKVEQVLKQFKEIVR